VCLLLAGAISCDLGPVELDLDEARAVSAAALTELLATYAAGDWAVVYISDEFAAEAVDSLLIAQLTALGVPAAPGRRAQVTIQYDSVQNGDLLLEPFTPLVSLSGHVQQHVRFASTSTFGGEVAYVLRRTAAGQWEIVRTTVVWMV
jgi:hypothetical protein